MDRPTIEWLGRVPYAAGLELQEHAAAAILEAGGRERVFLLEHDPVYTIGRHPDRSSAGTGALPHPLVDVGRGGKATYHGPGQLVGYPILDLRRRGRDLHAYLRLLEQVLIDTLASLGLPASRHPGRTGVWVGERKIASIGVGVRHWITRHGFALNVSNDLAPFQAIIPCGIDGVEMTSVEVELGSAPPLKTLAAETGRRFVEALGPPKTYGP